ncbi:hypothetical protein ALC53_12855 [Atta colombica]|uniref:Uncharacterized protein n=1 Tax=Atta colombica TaxID=520822 RepID=A0A151HZG5_9HYME|nr:hypothetical protein ALC53_12855 [Atta colombica]
MVQTVDWCDEDNIMQYAMRYSRRIKFLWRECSLPSSTVDSF